jgi:hypothetical protein
MSPYTLLPRHIQESLRGIESTQNGEIVYFPCSVTLTGGEVRDTVYFMPEKPVMKMWGVYLEGAGAKRLIRVEDVAEVRDSPTRLPARFANELYLQGESGMGYTIFTVVFSDGARQAYVTGDGVDFIDYPPGKGPLDVAAVISSEGRKAESLLQAPDSYWCIFAEEAE